MPTKSTQSLLHLLHLASSTLPVGAFSYSEGLETLVQAGQITQVEQLQHWLTQDLTYGAIRLEGLALVQAYETTQNQDWSGLAQWNDWLSAVRESYELRQQSWMMGRSLTRLLTAMAPEMQAAIAAGGDPCNFAIAVGLAAAQWQIPRDQALLGYLHSWASNMINAGIKLIPLGQTQGQTLLLSLYPQLEETQRQILDQPGDPKSCGWGLAIASMNHETLYSRLFRS
ncbi:MAG TPA: urease accessory protein UreF [Candidatus Obscuribacterales bacterium]